MQVQRPPVHLRRQDVALQLLHEHERGQHDQRVQRVLGDQRDQHGDRPGQERADDRQERAHERDHGERHDQRHAQHEQHDGDRHGVGEPDDGHAARVLADHLPGDAQRVVQPGAPAARHQPHAAAHHAVAVVGEVDGQHHGDHEPDDDLTGRGRALEDRA